MSDLVLESAFRIGMGETAVRFPTILDRLIHLRTLPNLGGLAGSGLTYVATHAVERHYEAGELIYRPDEPVGAAHFVVEGKVRVEQEGLFLLDCVPPFAIGFFPVLASSEVGQRAVALEPTVTLEIARADLLEIFEDDFSFLENGIRQLSRQLGATQRALEARGLVNRSVPIETPYPHHELDLVERLDLIGGGPYEEVNLEPLVQLVRRASELRLEPGDVLWEEGDPATWGFHIAHGVVKASSDERTFRMGPGSVLGFLEAHGDIPRSYRAVAETRVVALRVKSETFFDILEDSPSFARGYLSFLSKLLLGLQLKLARANADEEEE